MFQSRRGDDWATGLVQRIGHIIQQTSEPKGLNLLY